jgi:hypothetical protein
VSPRPIKLLSALSVAAVVAYVPVAQAFNFGDMMNPGRWFGGKGNRDYYDDYGPYGGGPWGGGPYGGPLGGGPWGGGPWGGGPYGGPYGGYGGPGYGGYGYGAAPAAPAPSSPSSSPSSSSGSSSSLASKQAEIDALKRRIDQLESRQMDSRQPQSSGGSSDWPSAPSFRPMNQY